MDDKTIEGQIKATVNQLTQAFLLDVAKKYGISPKDTDLLIDTDPIFDPPIEKDLYKVEGTCGHYQADIKVTLYLDKIEKRLKQYAPRGKSLPRWSFLGFIKEGTFHQSIIEECGDIKVAAAMANINTQISKSFPTPFIKHSIPYTAIFLIAYDTDDVWGFEEDVLTMIHLTRVPDIEDIKELKQKLGGLLTIKSGNDLPPKLDKTEIPKTQTRQNSIMDQQAADFLQSIDLEKKIENKLKKLGFSAEDIRDRILYFRELMSLNFSD